MLPPPFQPPQAAAVASPQPPSPPRPPPAAPVAAAAFEVINDVDFETAPGGAESVYEGLSLDGCQRQCIADAHLCAVAVYSSVSDEPPHACWVKSAVSARRAKRGVVALAPPGHPPLPAAPSGRGDGGGGGSGGGGDDGESIARSLASFSELPAVGQTSSSGLTREEAREWNGAVEHSSSGRRSRMW